MKRTKALIFATLSAGTLIGATLPARAGFYLEGLQPYTVDFCDEKNPDRNQPPVVLSDPNSETPDAASLQGHHAWISSCPVRMKKDVPGKGWMNAPVPQK